MKYFAPIASGFVGLYFFGPIGAVVAVLLWWCYTEIQALKQK